MYKAVELVFSLIFAFETRKVKVKELNDSKIIVFCVYTLVISAIALTPTTILLQNQPTAQYAVTGIVCLLTGTLLLAITFVPKVTTYTLRGPTCECHYRKYHLGFRIHAFV